MDKRFLEQLYFLYSSSIFFTQNPSADFVAPKKDFLRQKQMSVGADQAVAAIHNLWLTHAELLPEIGKLAANRQLDHLHFSAIKTALEEDLLKIVQRGYVVDLGTHHRPSQNQLRQWTQEAASARADWTNYCKHLQSQTELRQLAQKPKFFFYPSDPDNFLGSRSRELILNTPRLTEEEIIEDLNWRLFDRLKQFGLTTTDNFPNSTALTQLTADQQRQLNAALAGELFKFRLNLQLLNLIYLSLESNSGLPPTQALRQQYLAMAQHLSAAMSQHLAQIYEEKLIKNTGQTAASVMESQQALYELTREMETWQRAGIVPQEIDQLITDAGQKAFDRQQFPLEKTTAEQQIKNLTDLSRQIFLRWQPNQAFGAEVTSGEKRAGFGTKEETFALKTQAVSGDTRQTTYQNYAFAESDAYHIFRTARDIENDFPQMFAPRQIKGKPYEKAYYQAMANNLLVNISYFKNDPLGTTARYALIEPALKFLPPGASKWYGRYLLAKYRLPLGQYGLIDPFGLALWYTKYKISQRIKQATLGRGLSFVMRQTGNSIDWVAGGFMRRALNPVSGQVKSKTIFRVARRWFGKARRDEHKGILIIKTVLDLAINAVKNLAVKVLLWEKWPWTAKVYQLADKLKTLFGEKWLAAEAGGGKLGTLLKGTRVIGYVGNALLRGFFGAGWGGLIGHFFFPYNPLAIGTGAITGFVSRTAVELAKSDAFLTAIEGSRVIKYLRPLRHPAIFVPARGFTLGWLAGSLLPGGHLLWAALLGSGEWLWKTYPWWSKLKFWSRYPWALRTFGWLERLGRLIDFLKQFAPFKIIGKIIGGLLEIFGSPFTLLGWSFASIFGLSGWAAILAGPFAGGMAWLASKFLWPGLGIVGLPAWFGYGLGWLASTLLHLSPLASFIVTGLSTLGSIFIYGWGVSTLAGLAGGVAAGLNAALAGTAAAATGIAIAPLIAVGAVIGVAVVTLVITIFIITPAFLESRALIGAVITPEIPFEKTIRPIKSGAQVTGLEINLTYGYKPGLNPPAGTLDNIELKDRFSGRKNNEEKFVNLNNFFNLDGSTITPCPYPDQTNLLGPPNLHFFNEFIWGQNEGAIKTGNIQDKKACPDLGPIPPNNTKTLSMTIPLKKDLAILMAEHDMTALCNDPVVFGDIPGRGRQSSSLPEICINEKGEIITPQSVAFAETLYNALKACTGTANIDESSFFKSDEGENVKKCLRSAPYNIPDPAIVQLGESINAYKDLQCVGYIKAIEVVSGGLELLKTSFPTAASFAQDIPGYKFYVNGSTPPLPGDIIVFGTGFGAQDAGHMALVIEAEKQMTGDYKLVVADANLDGGGLIRHDYLDGQAAQFTTEHPELLGWLRRR